MNALTKFINDELYPELFKYADKAFPEMRLTKHRGGWATSLKLDGSTGSHPRADKCVITKDCPRRILEQGGSSKDLLSLWKENNGKTSIFEAVEGICKILGITPPPRQSSEEWEEFCKKVEAREKVLAKMKRAIQDPQGADVIDYLRNTRGYSEDYITKLVGWGIGALTPEVASEMGDELPRSLDLSQHKMAIPYYSGGYLLGFIFRDTTGTAKAKYRFTFGLGKKASLFGLTGLKLSGNREKDRTLTIVEGQLDALHAQLCGIDNVVALGGNKLSDEALIEAKKKGVERVVLILDTEGDEAKDAERDKDRAEALRTIHKAGMEGYIVTLPSDNGKIDVDEYLNKHSIEQLEAVIECKEPASIFLYRQLQKEAQAKYEAQQQHEVWDPLNISDFKRKILDLISSSITSPIYRESILAEVSHFTNGTINKDALREEAEARVRLKEIEKHKDATKKLTEEAHLLAQAGRAEEAQALLAKQLPYLAQMKRESEFSTLLHKYTNEDLQSDLQRRRDGIPTSFIFSKGGSQEVFTLPAGGITLICAPTSHGKSTLLQNLALQVAQRDEEGDVLYFTFEEDKSNVQLQMINKYINKEITRETYKKDLGKRFNNLTTLRQYAKTGDLQFAKAELWDEIVAKYNAFENLPIRIYGESMDARKLRDAIAYLYKHIKVKAVFIDYIQLLRIDGYKGERRAELCEISQMFNDLAKETSLPIVMATQLNRKSGSPLDMNAQNIAESADIERYSNTLLCLWNSAFKPTTESTSTSKELEAHQKQLGYNLGTAGKIYAVLPKNREGTPWIEAVLDHNGNSGAITQPKTIQPETVNPTTQKINGI